MIKDIVERFKQDTKNHTMAVLQDEDVCRHLIFRQPDTNSYYFGIVTWPMHLCIYGDVGTYVFSRLRDMFDFHRGPEFDHIDLNYWEEKLQSTAKPGGHKEYSQKRFKEVLNQYFEEWVEYGDLDDKNLRKEVREELDELACCENEYEAHTRANAFESSSGHTLTDIWEHDFNDFTHHYVWCCLAIRYAITKYDKYKNSY